MQHVHSELIKRWADGAEIEFKNSLGGWFDANYNTWSPEVEYRIKVKKEPTRVTWFPLFKNGSLGMGYESKSDAYCYAQVAFIRIEVDPSNLGLVQATKEER